MQSFHIKLVLAMSTSYTAKMDASYLWEAQGGEACDRVPGKIDGIKLNVSQRV
jgi:hypothetical protein